MVSMANLFGWGLATAEAVHGSVYRRFFTAIHGTTRQESEMMCGLNTGGKLSDTCPRAKANGGRILTVLR
jgi:hypothetical protein